MRIASAALIASTLALAACGGGGGGGTAPSPVAPPISTAAPQQDTGSIPMSIGIPRAPSASGRTPSFVSPNLGSVALYDGATLVYVANVSLQSPTQFTTVYAKSGPTTVTPGTCTTSPSTVTCTVTVTANTGAHKFDLVAYTRCQSCVLSSTGRQPLDLGTPPAFQGVISSEGELSVTLSPGTNAAATLTLLGVADTVTSSGLAEVAYNATASYAFRIKDSSGAQIVQPGTAYDNGPVTVTGSPAGLVTITPNSFAAPPATVGDQSFSVQCINTAGGAVTITYNARTSPNTAYASALTYSTSNYSGATIGSFGVTCDPATATIPITIDGKRRQ